MTTAKKKGIFYDCVDRLLTVVDENLTSCISSKESYEEAIKDLDKESYDYKWKLDYIEEYNERIISWNKLKDKLEAL